MNLHFFRLKHVQAHIQLGVKKKLTQKNNNNLEACLNILYSRRIFSCVINFTFYLKVLIHIVFTREIMELGRNDLSACQRIIRSCLLIINKYKNQYSFICQKILPDNFRYMEFCVLPDSRYMQLVQFCQDSITDKLTMWSIYYISGIIHSLHVKLKSAT